MKYCYLIFLCVFLITPPVFSAVQEPDVYCPHIDETTKNPITQKWNAQTRAGTWKSYNTSFASDLTQFEGAQWNGENVGTLTCIYKSEQRFTEQGQATIQSALPVRLVFYALTYEPQSGKWKHAGHGIYNCYAFQQKHCPFKIRIKKQITNIYQEAESLKSSSSNQIQPESY